METTDTAIIRLPNATGLQTVEPVFEIDNQQYEIPALFLQGGERGMYFFVEFFSATIENPHTRRAYVTAVLRFARWCDRRGLDLFQLNQVYVSQYINDLKQDTNPDGKLSKPSIKQHLAALRMLFDHLVINHVVPFNPTAGVKGPKYVVKKGKTPVLTASETYDLFQAIDTTTLAGLRDRALIGIMGYSFARIEAVLGMNVEDYYQEGKKRWKFRFLEKGGQHHTVAAHHLAQEYVDEYLEAAGIEEQKKSPLFRSFNRKRQLTERRLHQREALAMVKRRARRAGLPNIICNHTFRATGITTYLLGGGKGEIAQKIANHTSYRTTAMYDRRDDEVTQEEIERIRYEG